MVILYGGAFNPPTKAHLAVINHLIELYPNCQLILLPTGNQYQKQDLIAFEHRVAMLNQMIEEIPYHIQISDYEMTTSTYEGTYYTLKHFHHPHFVIGADQLENINRWIRYPDVVIENQFIVIPRNNIDIESIFATNALLHQYKDHFTVIQSFKPLDIASSQYRLHLQSHILHPKVLEYIEKNNLYEVN